MDERRIIPRRHLRSYLQILDRTTDLVIGHLVNISETGAMIISEDPINNNEKYRLRLDLPEEFEGSRNFDLNSTGVWCKRDRINPNLYASGFAIEKNQPDDERIGRFIERYCLSLDEEKDTRVQ